ncbi:dTDP-4-dehydrorhamnose reductase family protein [Marinobacter caseinilyticus]|uniref:dTDP-4-dehydrorhamnose reductase family protein n=1 Tax=Marinobacter caseinilyticus TaxID=2692195 RepID=UPI00140755FB|nr:SDR family oxidoreductase [Marinobacter caseinilyticus]
MRILVLGVTGMLGSAVFKTLAQDASHEAWGTLRSGAGLAYFTEADHDRLIAGVDVLDHDSLVQVFNRIRPDAVVNCVGLIKQLSNAQDPLIALPINSMFPHRLARLCDLAKVRLVHISTDCVFSGRKGRYLESDVSDAEDLYGKSKYIGELHSYPHAITLRTSIIGQELSSRNALIDWFLGETGSIRGFSKAIFSGLPTVELARVIKDFVLPDKSLAGLYHVAAEPISKLDLLRLVADEYEKEIEIRPDDSVEIDRSLNGHRFSAATGYVAPGWPELIQTMRQGV